MTEREICYSYRNAKHKAQQIQIIADLSGRKKLEVITVLVRNGAKLPESEVKKLYKRLDVLEDQIKEREREYKEIVAALKGE